MRILASIWFVQVLTALIVLRISGAADPLDWALGAVLVLGLGLLAAVWIRGMLKDHLKLSEARYKERMAQKAEAFKTELSRHKAREAERLAEISTNNQESRTGLLRAGIVTGGAVGLGAALIVAQFVGIFLLLAAFAGGAAAVYAVSGRRRRSLSEPLAGSPANTAIPKWSFPSTLTAARN